MTTYAAMRQEFIDLLNRTDCTDPDAALVKSWFDKSIQMCQREVRAPHMERVMIVDTSTISVDEVIIPDDWVETKAIVFDDGSTQSSELDPLELGTYYSRKYEVFDTPTYYCRRYDRWLINCAFPQGSTAEVIYYGEEQPLINDADETTLAKIAPDLIEYGALISAAIYFTDDRLQSFKDMWQFLREQIQDQSSDGDNSNGANAVQPFVMYDDGI